jgi:hypothetical protein
MGDCRIRIVISKDLVCKKDDISTQTARIAEFATASSSAISVVCSANEKTVSFSRLYSADTTVREVVEGNGFLWNLFSINTTSSSSSSSSRCCNDLTFSLWDCTIHPPRNITSWPLHDYPDLQGVKSMTLHTAGWFPSGTLLAIPKDMIPSQFVDQDSYVDVQFNTQQRQGLEWGVSSRKGTKEPELQDPSLRCTDGKPLPSKVMESVVNRFSGEVDDANGRLSESGAAALRSRNKQQRVQKENERAAKLEARIARLEEQAETNEKSQKSTKVSDQVLRMLVKSRATGDKNLKMHDRIYFQCMVLIDCDVSSANGSSSYKEYRYFSPQDTFAKIANTFSARHSSDKFLSEVLCRQHRMRPSDKDSNNTIKDKEKTVHRRFPVSMRVYEAIADGFVKDTNQVDTLIVRFYLDREDATPSIFEHEQEDDNISPGSNTASGIIHDIEMEDAKSDGHPASAEPGAANKVVISPNHVACSGDATILKDIGLANTIKQTDDINDKGKKTGKQASSAALKVKHMKMKSKAKGDNKRIPRMEDRFVLEVVTILDSGSAAFEYCFLAKHDPLERILQYATMTSSCFSPNAPDSFDFLVPAEDNDCFRFIRTTSIMLQEAEHQGILKPYDRLILRPKPMTEKK